jgi:hypothetical protein
MNENQTSTSESRTNNATSRSNQNEKEKEKKQSKRKQNSHPKKKLKNNDLDSNQYKEVYRPLMTFTKVFTQLMRRKEQCIGFEFHSTGKNSMKQVKKATRSN